MVVLPPNYVYRPPELEHRSFLVNLVIKLSGGKVTNAQQALFVLFIVATALILLTLVIIWNAFLTTDNPTSDSDHPEGIEWAR